MARGKKHTPEQIVSLLRQVEVAVASGKTTAQASKEASITEQTYYRWRKEFGGLQVDQARRLKELEQENAKLKRLVAELTVTVPRGFAMTNLAVVHPIASAVDALPKTPNPISIASAPGRSESLLDNFYYDVDEYLVEGREARPRKSRTCVLALIDNGNRPSCNCEHCGRETKGEIFWEGTLWDSTSAMNPPEDQPFVEITQHAEYGGGTREGIISIMKSLATKAGFQFFELREYYPGSGYDYKPLSCGLVTALSSTD